MAHAIKPSIDLEGGESAPIVRRPSTLATRSARTSIITEGAAAASPASPTISISPSYSRPSPWLEAPTGSENHFTTLPPSPPTRSIEFPPPSSARYLSGAESDYPTPPASVPGSAKVGSGFSMGLHGVTVVVDDGGADSRQSSSSEGEGSWNEGANKSGDSARVKRRPSFILTTTPAQDEPQGLAINLDMSGSLPSPRLGGRRSYPTDPSSTTPLHSPAFPSAPYLSTSPVSSPTSSSFPNFLSSNSPTLGSASTAMERAPSSPRLSTLTDPLSRLATATSGLVRRASSTSLNTDLPTSVVRSPSPSGRIPPSPTLSTPSLSPNLAGGEWGPRRRSVASQAREKEQEKERELQEREDKKKVASYHTRMFSWAERPGDVVKRRSASGSSKKRRLLLTGFLVVGLVVCALALRSSGEEKRMRARHAATAASRPTTTVGSRLRRPRGGGGASFIHPDVVERPKVVSASLISAPWRWLRRFAAAEDYAQAATRSPSGDARTHSNRPDDKPVKPVKRKSIFSIAPHVAYTEHQALPPPPLHSDAPERDTLVLYRILGNDLPPRHSPGQTLRNLRFLLQYESDFSVLPPLGPHHVHHAHAYGSGSGSKTAHSAQGGLRVDKYFVLNRIAEPEMVSAIIGLLHLYSVPNSRILVIPFDWNEYQRREFRWDGGVDSTPGWGIGSGPFPGEGAEQPWAPPAPGDIVDGQVITEEESQNARKRHEERRTLARLRALDFTYHEKNLYAMNNNGGRNFALHHGRSLPNARWILPLDGNSFFTPAAMYSIVSTLSITGEGPSASRYLIIPMARLLNNDDVRRNNSIALVPKEHAHEGASALADAEANHRPAAAPDTPEEPQIGFRYDSTESFQEAMRYGRRSKLEMLWRLGAIPYSRALDRRTLPWEFADRHHVTADSWGSIPGAPGTPSHSVVHHSHDHSDFQPWVEANPPRGPLAFAKAGWVYRLFSGHKSQEQHSTQAITLRNVNRIKGIIAFLERLDDRIARGAEGCLSDSEPSTHCGFSAERLWNFEHNAVERLRQKYRIGRRDALEKVDLFEQLIRPAFDSINAMQGDSSKINAVDAQKAATDSTLLAMAGYITGNSTYSSVASHFIGTRFVKQTPLFYRQSDQREQLRKYSSGSADQQRESIAESIVAENGNAYVFPPAPAEPGQTPTWNAETGARVSRTDIPQLPFDPLNFDPSFLLDAIRLLSHSNAPAHDLSSHSSRKAITPMFISHLSYLLYAPPAVAICRHPDSPPAGAAYDAKVASLAAFLDDARLLGRVANRARLRLPPRLRTHDGLMESSEDVREVHWRLVQGLANVRLRPYSLVVDSIGDGRFMGSAHGMETPLDVLGV